MPVRTEGREARFLFRAHHKYLCTKIIKSLQRAGGTAVPCSLSVGVPDEGRGSKDEPGLEMEPSEDFPGL